MSAPKGVIFLSHASEDKEIVENIYKRLDAAVSFYDLRTIHPGKESIDAMKEGVENSSIFVLFHSKYTNKPWVDFEKDLAEIKKINSKSLQVLVCPINGETYNTLPIWMKKFMTTTENFGPSDIVRTILHLQMKALDLQKIGSIALIGREELIRKVSVDIGKAPAVKGVPIQQIVITGLPGIGRTSVARAIRKHALPAMRAGGPIFDLPEMAEAVDIFIKLREDIDGQMDKDELIRQMDAFQRLLVPEQANLILQYLLHFEALNQPVILATRWGLRDRTKQLKPWFRELLKLWSDHPSLRVIFVSERRLSIDEIANHKSIEQYYVDRLSDDDIQYMLSELIEDRLFDASLAFDVSKKILGHPATAKYVSTLVNSGRSFDTLVNNPDPIYAFQEKMLESIFDNNILSSNQRKIINLLGFIPRLPLSMISKILGEPDKKTLSEELWGLLDFSLIESSQGGYYSVPDIVSSLVRRDSSLDSRSLFESARSAIDEEMKVNGIKSDLIDSLLVASVGSTGGIPSEISGLVSSSSLLTLVQDLFFRARVSHGMKQKELYQKTYALSKFAMGMKTSDDAVEQILFTGGDCAIRSGNYPDDILDFMEKRAMASIYYLKGSYAFYVKRNYKEASVNLRKAFELRHFRVRNARLLVKSYIRQKKFNLALDVLDEFHEDRLMRDSGLVILKITALRGARKHKEANQLEATWKPSADLQGELSLYKAVKALQQKDVKTARSQVEIARSAPNINRLSFQLMDCAVAIEENDFSLLAETVAMADGAGRFYDSLQLRAKVAVKQGDWKAALDLIDEIESKQIFDLQTECDALQLKLKDPTISRNPVEMEATRLRYEEAIVQTVNSPYGYRDA